MNVPFQRYCDVGSQYIQAARSCFPIMDCNLWCEFRTEVFTALSTQSQVPVPMLLDY